jgi:hypothetical protein
MRVFSGGSLAGQVTGTLALHSDDPVLREIWERALRRIPDGSGDIEGRLRKVLESHGYRVE